MIRKANKKKKIIFKEEKVLNVKKKKINAQINRAEFLLAIN